VLGASRGTGLACAERLASEGADVVLVARDEGLLADAAEVIGRGTEFYAVDLTQPDATESTIAAIVEQHGRVDILVSAIGLYEGVDSVLDAGDEVWDRHVEPCLHVPRRAMLATIPGMCTNGGGAIVVISTNSIGFTYPPLAHYSALKLALSHFTRNVGREFASQGVRANVVCPGGIRSERVDVMFAALREQLATDDAGVTEHLNETFNRQLTWSDRLAETSEVADLVTFLSSDRARYINGAWIPIDGGSSFR